MKTTTHGLLALLMMLIVQFSFAQQKSVNGTVVDEDGIPIPSVNVFIKGTSQGTQTNFDGEFTVEASPDQTIVFSYVGFVTQEILVGEQTTINVTLVSDVEQLNEVLVTAQGIKREKKALGYAVTTLDSEDVVQKPDTDLGRLLRGKAAGVRVTGTGGVSGSGSNIIIRGFSSITGGNQPLFVVDGVLIDGSTGGANQSSSSANFQSGNVRSGFADIDPNNIESISILKGQLNVSVL